MKLDINKIQLENIKAINDRVNLIEYLLNMKNIKWIVKDDETLTNFGKLKRKEKNEILAVKINEISKKTQDVEIQNRNDYKQQEKINKHILEKIQSINERVYNTEINMQNCEAYIINLTEKVKRIENIIDIEKKIKELENETK